MKKVYSSDMPHPVNKEFGRLVKERRVEKEMSQFDLAGGLGISYQQLQKYESGVNRISLLNAFKINRILGISFNDFEKAYVRGEAIANGR